MAPMGWRRCPYKLNYYPIPSDCDKLHATSAIVPGETAMLKGLPGALRGQARETKCAWNGKCVEKSLHDKLQEVWY